MKPMPFTKHHRLLMLASLLIIFAAAVMHLAGFGLNLGIDFTGGSLLEYAVGESFSVEDVTGILTRHGYKDSRVSKAASGEDGTGEMTNLQIRLSLQDAAADMEKALAEVQKAHALTPAGSGMLTMRRLSETGAEAEFAGGYEYRYTGSTDEAAFQNDLEAALMKNGVSVKHVKVQRTQDGLQVFLLPLDQAGAVREILEREMGQRYPGFTYVSLEHTGAVSSADLIANALKALAIALILMLIYIALRFDFYSGMIALFGLAHDVLIMLAFMTFFRSVYQVNSSFIAALLTIVGYSINNTIIVFDRVRESKRENPENLSNMEIVEESERASFSRSVNTTLTTLFTLVALYGFGVDSIREFTFPLIVGMLAGSYSSLLLNGPLWAKLVDRAEKRKMQPSDSKPSSC